MFQVFFPRVLFRRLNAFIKQDKPGRELVQATDDALQAGISICKPNAPFKAIGDAIDKLARSHGMSVSSQFTGHGIGRVFHRAPWILHHSMGLSHAIISSIFNHYITENDEPGTMRPGHCFTIEVNGDIIYFLSLVDTQPLLGSLA
jgi:methionyl aminopeptidase